MPAEVAHFLRAQGLVAFTLYELQLERLADEEVVIYAGDRGAVAVTTNRNFLPVARRLRACPTVHLRVTEEHCREAMKRALEWLSQPDNHLPPGFVLRTPRFADLRVVPPTRWT